MGSVPSRSTSKSRASAIHRCATSALAPALAVSAVLMAMSVGSAGHAWMAWIGLLPLLAAARALSPVRAGLVGGTWGLLFYAAAVSGIAPTITPGALSLILLAAVPAAYCALGSLATRAVGFVPIILALLWILAEVALRPLGLRSGLLASTQADGNLANYIAGLLGYVFVASAIVYANAWLLNLLSQIRLSLPEFAIAGRLPRPSRFFSEQVGRPVPAICFADTFPRGPPQRSSRNFTL